MWRSHHVKPATRTASAKISIPYYGNEAMTIVRYLKGAKFSTPSSEMVETKAIGLGTMPLIISVWSFLWNVKVASTK